MQPSRRAFLLAGRALGGPWGRFYQRLSRSVKGRLEDRTAARNDPGLAWLQPSRLIDIQHALALCAESGVRFALDGYAPADGMPCLMVDPSALDTFTALPDGGIEADAGARVADVRARLQDACPGAHESWTLAQWLAAPAGYPVAQLGCSGLASVEVLLADRTLETFGPFGASSQRAALSVKASRLVSDLFTWVSQPPANGWGQLKRWPGRYRVDALLADTPNLAHLLLGSGGTLAWPDRIRLEPVGVSLPDADRAMRTEPQPADLNAGEILDARIKQRFDPAGLFP